MDWDGIGTFAMFLATGGVTVGLIWLAAFRAKLRADVEKAKLGGASSELIEDLRQEVHDLMAQHATQMDEIHERMDFTERLLSKGKGVEPTSQKGTSLP